MKIEQLYEKGSRKLNEDALLIQDTLFGVFDGASSMDKYADKDGHTGAYVAANIAKEIFKKNEGQLVELAKKANEKIRDEMAKAEIDTSKPTNLWFTTAAAIRLNGDSFDWVQIGDSLILVINKDGSYKLLVDEYDHDMETLTMWKKLAEKKVEEIYKELHDQSVKVRNQVGISYGALSGQREMDKFLNSGTESLKNVKHVILFTDGLIVPKENPQEKDDFEIFVKLFLQGGLKKVRDHVRKLEDDDPKCWKHPRFKQYDDIAAIAVSF